MSENKGSFLEDLLNNSEEVTVEDGLPQNQPTEEALAEELVDGEIVEPETIETENDVDDSILPNTGRLSNQTVQRGISTDADIVFCIDSTGSMDLMIDRVKDMALSFNERLYKALEAKSRMPRKIRIKVIGFRDFFYDIMPNPPIQASDFFTILGNDDPSEDIVELQNFRDFVSGLQPRGGEDEPESGLEALHLAFTSDWSNDPNVTKRRHIVVLFTDAEPHDLSDSRRNDPNQNPGNNYPTDCPTNLSGLYSEYCAMESGSDETTARRLFLFAPKRGIWNTIQEEWDQVQIQAPVPVNKQEINGEVMYDFSGDALFKFLAGSM